MIIHHRHKGLLRGEGRGGEGRGGEGRGERGYCNFDNLHVCGGNLGSYLGFETSFSIETSPLLLFGGQTMHASTHTSTFLCELNNVLWPFRYFPCPWWPSWQPSWISIHLIPLRHIP